MRYYTDGKNLLASMRENLPFQALDAPPEGASELCWLFEREPSACRCAYAPFCAGQLYAPEEGVHWLDSGRLPWPEQPDPFLARMLELERVRAVNLSHPKYGEIPAGPLPTGKKRLNLLAAGAVGGTLLIGLRLLGADVLSSIGVCDIDPNRARRWELELGQVAWPFENGLPPVRAIGPEALFDGDVFVFCASAWVPPLDTEVKDVRMAQYAANAPLVAQYARMAREQGFRGLFAVVSDPVDPLCKAALDAGCRDTSGHFDGGLLPEQIRGYGLGVMNARASYYAARDERFSRYASEGRAYGPHGADLVIADSVFRYDDNLSRELSALAGGANWEVRALGYKPFVAPALSSAALPLLLTLRGRWHYSAVFLGGIFMGCKNRQLPMGTQVEALPLPEALYRRIEEAARHLADIH